MKQTKEYYILGWMLYAMYCIKNARKPLRKATRDPDTTVYKGHRDLVNMMARVGQRLIDAERICNPNEDNVNHSHITIKTIYRY